MLFTQPSELGRLMYPVKYKDVIATEAKKFGVDPYFVAAIIRVESNFDRNKISTQNAIGLMQILPDTASYVIARSQLAGVTQANLEQSDANIYIGTAYLRILADTFASDLQNLDTDSQIALLAAAYNAGPGITRTWLNQKSWNGSYDQIDQIDIGETRHYIQRVVYYYNKYKSLDVFEVK